MDFSYRGEEADNGTVSATSGAAGPPEVDQEKKKKKTATKLFLSWWSYLR